MEPKLVKWPGMDVARGMTKGLHFPLRGIKGFAAFMPMGRLYWTGLEDTVEYVNLILQLTLNAEEKKDLGRSWAGQL